MLAILNKSAYYIYVCHMFELIESERVNATQVPPDSWHSIQNEHWCQKAVETVVYHSNRQGFGGIVEYRE